MVQVLHLHVTTTGENGLFGEFLTNAQGEDVVAGVRTPMHISRWNRNSRKRSHSSKMCAKHLAYYRDIQDMEFA